MHTYILLSVVIVTLPSCCACAYVAVCVWRVVRADGRDVRVRHRRKLSVGGDAES